MLPKYTALFEAHRKLCAQRGIRYGVRDLHDVQIAIARGRLLASKVAGNRAHDEPAALLLALLLEAEALGELRDAFPVAATRMLLAAEWRHDVTLTMIDRIALRAFRARALPHRDAPDQLEPIFDELRAFVAARLRPLP